MRLSGKFTPEEAEIIKKFQESHKINDNQLVKKAVINYVEIQIGVEELSKHPKFIKFLKKYMKDLEVQYEKRKIGDQLEKSLMNKSKHDLVEFVHSLEKINYTSEILEKKKKPGPKKTEKKRGRPSDKGR